MSPGTYLADASEVVVPLGIVGGLLVFGYLVWVHDDSFRLDTQYGLFGWLGAFVGGSTGVWLAIHQLTLGSTFAQVYDETLTILSIGIAVGVLAGNVTTRASRSASPHEAAAPAVPDREAVVAESTWTNRSGPDPIVMEVVDQLSDLEETDPIDLEPLSTSIDPEVFHHLRTGDESPWQVIFYAAGYEIRVNSQGTVTVNDYQQSAEEPAVATDLSSSVRRDGSSSSYGSRERSVARAEPAPPAEAVCKAVAESEQVEPAELPPLDEWVHPATYDALTGPWTQLDRSLEFTYVWYQVTVHPTGDVRIRG